MQRYRSSQFAERAFCAVCGSHLWMREVGADGKPADGAAYELMPGLFVDTRDWALRSEIYIDRAMASARLAGEHVRKTRAAYEAQSPHIDEDLA